jgi:23S rRNA pseudouridine1911/1915/1917 synthase
MSTTPIDHTANFNPLSEGAGEEEGAGEDIEQTLELVVEEDGIGERLDKWLAAKIPVISRSKAQWLLEHDYISVNGAVCTGSSTKMKAGDTVRAVLPRAPVTDILPVNLPLDIVFEDDQLLVINKAAGMAVHPAPGHYDDTLVNALLYYCGAELSAIGGEARPGIVHRLDKDTSGLIVVAKNDQAHRKLAAQLEDRSLTRVYHALVWGAPNPLQGTIRASLARSPQNRQKMAIVEDGRDATTHYKTLRHLHEKNVSLIACKLETGRTHQIRIHMTHKGHPLLGDEVYGRQSHTRIHRLPEPAQQLLSAFKRQALHAVHMGFIHPKTGERMTFNAPWPEPMQKLAEAIGLEQGWLEESIKPKG